MKTKSNIVTILRNDSEISPIIKQGKLIQINYDLYKGELEKFTVGAIKFKILDEKEFEYGLTKLYRVQAYLDRISSIKMEITDKKREVMELYQSASVLLSTFDAVKKFGAAAQRENLIDEVLLVLSRKRDKLIWLWEAAEQRSWNLRNTHSTMNSEFDWAKQILYMRFPERHLKAGK